MIDFEHVSKQYKHNAKPALEDVNFHVDDGEFVFLLGHSGAGKSTLLKLILREVFKQGSIESLDQETLFTIQRFVENNLNVSETSRGLFVHRNTLVYRLEKIKKLTGLDLREFDDAIVFKVALMVKKYLSNNPAKY